MAPSVLWFRRDLRLHDNPALLEAARSGDGTVVALFVLDPKLWDSAGPTRRAYLARSLASLDRALGGRLLVRSGNPVQIVAEVMRSLGARTVHAAADFGPYGARRDEALAAELGDAFVRTGSPYAVAPGRVTKPDGTPYRVYTPFYRAWVGHGWRAPAGPPPDGLTWLGVPGGERLPDHPDLGGLTLPPAGETAALGRWSEFLTAGGVDGYADHRDRADLKATSQLGAALRWGEIHPRTLLAELGDAKGHEVFRKELAWREFYADVLHHQPASARHSLRPELSAIEVDEGPTAVARFDAWRRGLTGYPFVDAGMRQLLAEGWMHNRVRMVTASFLIKDLHVDWTLGARHFMRLLRDGDLASNQHGWQWVAGTGTDAAPYFRVFNPVSQGRRFDPDGDYVRRYVPELAGVPGGDVHEPWALAAGLPPRYPERIVDHAVEREVALARYAAVRAAPGPLA